MTYTSRTEYQGHAISKESCYMLSVRVRSDVAINFKALTLG